jgi:hypothetical protein
VSSKTRRTNHCNRSVRAQQTTITAQLGPLCRWQARRRAGGTFTGPLDTRIEDCPSDAGDWLLPGSSCLGRGGGSARRTYYESRCAWKTTANLLESLALSIDIPVLYSVESDDLPLLAPCAMARRKKSISTASPSRINLAAASQGPCFVNFAAKLGCSSPRKNSVTCSVTLLTARSAGVPWRRLLDPGPTCQHLLRAKRGYEKLLLHPRTVQLKRGGLEGGGDLISVHERQRNACRVPA